MSEFHGHWKKGSLHNHTLWSDGRSLPEVALSRIRGAGFDFVCLSDHNIFQDLPDAWVQVQPEEGSWPPAFSRAEFDLANALELMPDTRNFSYTTSVRLRTFRELRAKFERPGEFLLIPGGEITTHVRKCDDRPGVFQLHMNYFNVPETLPELVGRNLDETVKLNWNSYCLAAEKVAGVTAFQFNHPLWPRYDGPPELLIDNPQIRHFEVCNNTIDFPELPGVYDCGRYWDIVNAFRCLHGDQLLLGSAGDDAHCYDDARIGGVNGVGSGWVMVHVPGEFTVDAVLAAMNRGDYYSTTGVRLDMVCFDEKSGRLSVRTAEEEKYHIRFIVTKRNFDQHTLEEYFYWKDDFDRQLTKYGCDIGICVQEQADVSEASYTMAPDDLYVRAEVISARPGRFAGFPYPSRLTAWTQPYRR